MVVGQNRSIRCDDYARTQSLLALRVRFASAKLIAEYPLHIRAYDLLVEHGEDLRPLPFDERRARLEALIGFLDGVCRPGGKWSNERVVVFTEYAATLDWITRILGQRGYREDFELAETFFNSVTRRIFTPAEFRSELNTFQGSAFSVAPKLTQSAWFRPHNRDPHIPGLYLVGAGTHPGAGLPGVINSAKATAGVIAKDLGL